jgi:hypothetical protein
VARLNEDRVALARFVGDRGRDDQAKFDLAVVAGSVRTQQATRLTCATADPNCCHLGCTARRRGNQAASSLAGLGPLGPLS